MSLLKKPQVYQFKISLICFSPKIWRRIQVPEGYKFLGLHKAIQDAMGWEDYHLHEFEIISPETIRKERIGIIDENDFPDYELLDEKKAKIATYFSKTNKKAIYSYDFGDDWSHEILFEKILPAEAQVKYPRCIDGENACPPEDCGGVWGYEEMLEIIQDPKHPEYQNRLD
ncbi:MAG: plasmid pRiA4b ORF-3 family protein, partial [Pseudomonadota bacterium]